MHTGTEYKCTSVKTQQFYKDCGYRPGWAKRGTLDTYTHTHTHFGKGVAETSTWMIRKEMTGKDYS
jgi:hypothetical protein